MTKVRSEQGGAPEASSSDVDDESEPAPRLSVLRVAVAALLVVGGLSAATFGVKRAVTPASGSTLTSTWFAPYLDTTLPPVSDFQDPAKNPSRQVALGFVVADPKSACTPSWGGFYTPEQAAQSLNLDRRIALLRSQGSDAIVSFGGQSNTELAVACTSLPQLEAAYQSVINRYHLTTVDFDIEGTALDNWASVQRRAAALADIQRQVRAGGHKLAIWLTLPAEPSGLQANALSVTTAMIRAHVDLAGVNAMTMDFSSPQKDMLSAVERALDATHTQLDQAYRSYGVALASDSVWNKIGATVMIGQNDEAGQQLTVAQATGLTTFATSHHLGRVSMWSLNRDAQCGSSFPELGVHANTCSGVAQSPLQFTRIFDHLSGTASSVAGLTTVSAYHQVTADNPATSPYPIWQPGNAYIAGYKVVRLGFVYQAKWYTTGDDPAAQTQYSYQTPWLLIGPVLAGDHAPTITTLPAGTYPTWGAKTAYQAGARVLFSGLPYRAKYYNQGDSPAAAAANASASPWTALWHVPGEPSTSG